MARGVFGLSTALASLSIAAALTQPSESATGTAIAHDSSAPPTSPPPPATTTTVFVAPPSTVLASPPTTLAPRAPMTTAPRTPAPPTSTAIYASSGKRERCGWSWDATHFDDGTLNEVTLVLEAPRRPNTPVTITAKPGASLLRSFATTTDAEGYASVTLTLSNDKRDWTLAIGAQFPGSSCDARSFTISYL